MSTSGADSVGAKTQTTDLDKRPQSVSSGQDVECKPASPDIPSEQVKLQQI